MNLGDMRWDLQLKAKASNKSPNSIPHFQPRGMSLDDWEQVIDEHLTDGCMHFWVTFVSHEPRKLSGNQP